MGNPITLTVSGTPPTGTYTSASNKVATNGDITINPGVTSITFNKDATWTYVSPYISFTNVGETNPFGTPSGSASSITISDTDPGGGRDRPYEYTLHTSDGNFDPKIINKGT